MVPLKLTVLKPLVDMCTIMPEVQCFFSFFVAQIFLAKTREGSKGRKKAKNVRPRTSVDTDRLVIDRSELFSIWISKLN
jgi:hypothetical protein